MREVNVLDQLLPVRGAFYVMDRGLLDLERLLRFHEGARFFVTRGRLNLEAQRRYRHTVDRTTGLLCDQTVALRGFYSLNGVATPLRRIRFKDPKASKSLIILTNSFTRPPLAITELYKCSWQMPPCRK